MICVVYESLANPRGVIALTRSNWSPEIIASELHSIYINGIHLCLLHATTIFFYSVAHSGNFALRIAIIRSRVRRKTFRFINETHLLGSKNTSALRQANSVSSILIFFNGSTSSSITLTPTLLISKSCWLFPSVNCNDITDRRRLCHSYFLVMVETESGEKQKHFANQIISTSTLLRHAF